MKLFRFEDSIRRIFAWRDSYIVDSTAFPQFFRLQRTVINMHNHFTRNERVLQNSTKVLMRVESDLSFMAEALKTTAEAQNHEGSESTFTYNRLSGSLKKHGSGEQDGNRNKIPSPPSRTEVVWSVKKQQRKQLLHSAGEQDENHNTGRSKTRSESTFMMSVVLETPPSSTEQNRKVEGQACRKTPRVRHGGRQS